MKTTTIKLSLNKQAIAKLSDDVLSKAQTTDPGEGYCGANTNDAGCDSPDGDEREMKK